MSVRGYTLEADWSRHGTYANALEDVTGYVVRGDVVSVSSGRDTTQAGGDAAAGTLGFTLTNDSRLFSPENVSSPIAGKVLPGVPVQFHVDHAGVRTTLFSGVMDEFTADTTSREFTAEALDGWGRPGAERLSTPVYSGVRTGDAIGLVLDAIGWAGGRDLDPGATLIPWWWEEGTDAATAVKQLVASEGPPAIAYVRGGTFVFRDRHHRLLRAESTTSQGTYTHITPAGGGPAGAFKILRDTFSYDHGLKSIVNAATFVVEQRRPIDVAEVWSTDDPILIPAGQSTQVYAQASDPFIGALTPTVGAGIEMRGGTVTAALSRTSGQSTVITLTAGGTDAIVARLALRATSLPVAQTTKVAVEDAASIGRYQRQEWTGEPPVWAGPGDAQVIASRIVSIYATARPVVRLAIANLDDTYMAQILARQVSDRITIRNDEMGLNADFMVERISHTIKGLSIHTLELVCEVPEPTQPANVFTFNAAGKGFNDGAFGIDGIDNAGAIFMFDVPGRGFNQGVFAS